MPPDSPAALFHPNAYARTLIKTIVANQSTLGINPLRQERKTKMTEVKSLDNAYKLFIAWAFFLQIVFIIHFAVRKLFFESYTMRYGWVVYALCIPAIIISIIFLRDGMSWVYWIGGFLFGVYAAFGFWVDYVARIQFRNPVRLSVLIPYAILYMVTVMFYWWPLYRLNRTLWGVYAVLYVIATILNVISH